MKMHCITRILTKKRSCSSPAVVDDREVPPREVVRDMYDEDEGLERDEDERWERDGGASAARASSAASFLVWLV